MKRKPWVRVLALVLAVTLMISLVSFDFDQMKFRTRQDWLENYVALAQTNMEEGDYTAAEQNLSKAIACIGRKTETEQIAELYLTRSGIRVLCTQDDEGALADAQEVIAIDPESPEPYAILAQIHLNAEDYSAAEQDMENYLALGGDSQGYETLAAILNAQGKSEEALAAFDKVDTTESMAAYQKGVILQSLGRTEEALEVFEECAVEDEYGAASAYNAAAMRMEREEYEEAEENLSKVLLYSSEVEGLHFNRAVCRMAQGKYETAAEDFAASIEENYSTRDSYRNLAVCRMQLNDYAAALEALEHLISDKIPADEILYYRAVCLCQVERYAESIEDFTRCIEEQYMETESRFNRGLLCAALGDTQTALEDFSYCIEADYQTEECYYQRAQIYKSMGKDYLYHSDMTHCPDRAE